MAVSVEWGAASVLVTLEVDELVVGEARLESHGGNIANEIFYLGESQRVEKASHAKRGNLFAKPLRCLPSGFGLTTAIVL